MLFFAILQCFSVYHYLECAKLRAFFFYVPYVPSFFTCLTCLKFFMCLHFCTCITCPHFFKCFTCFRIFTCLACLHFSPALHAFIFYMLIILTQINEILSRFIKYFYSCKTRVISCVCTFFETENFD